MGRCRRWHTLGLWLALCGAAQAAPSVPFTPSAAGRHAVHLLIDEAGLDLVATQWPLPRASVQRALDALPTLLTPALDAARERLRRELAAGAGSGLSITLRNRADALPGFGDDATPGSSLALRSPALEGPYLATQVGGRVEAHAHVDRPGMVARLDESAVAVEALGWQLQAWAHRSWWGPGWQNALELGSNSPALAGMGVQRASASASASRWLSWMGAWNFEFFVARTEGMTQPLDPLFVGTRLTLRPFANLEIGLTRTAQWGGEGHDTSARALGRLLLGKGTNADEVADQPRDPGNQIGGIDLRLRCPGGLGCAAYMQLAGEDQGGVLPSRLLGLYGFEAWTPDGEDRFFAELVESGCRMPIGRQPMENCAYRNYAYPQGYVNAGRWLGTSAGPDSRVLTLGWVDALHGGSLRLHLGRVGSRIGSYSPLDGDPRSSGRLYGVALRRSFAWGEATLTPELDWSRVDAPTGPSVDTRVGLNLRMGLDGATDRFNRELAARWSGPEPDWTSRFVLGTVLFGGALLLDGPADRFAQRHGESASGETLSDVGNALPLVAVGYAGLSWLGQRGTPQGELGYAATAAGLSAVALAQAAKLAVGRARPSDNLGAGSFGEVPRSDSAFPSLHATLAWAVLTPYAKAYDSPWLYAAAALTNAARVMEREHWVSDTVAGAMLGYAMGDYFYRRQAGTAGSDTAARVWITPRSVVLNLPFK
ncbi:capsule assembly Wzi family protein [Sphaerotilaceae bacterium SBD11-9]